jgi:hypothetical protein
MIRKAAIHPADEAPVNERRTERTDKQRHDQHQASRFIVISAPRISRSYGRR